MIMNIVGVRVKLISNNCKIIEFIRGFNHILDIYWSEEKSSNDYDCTLTYLDQDIIGNKVIIEGYNVTYIAKWESVFRSTAIRTLLILISEKFRQHHLKQFTIHASAVSFGNKGFVFSGGQGSGKTTMAMSLTINDGFNYIANEYTILGQNNNSVSVFGATGPLSLRYESVNLSFPQIVKKIFPLDPDDSWNCKKRVDPSALKISIEYKPVELEGIFIIRLDKSGSNYFNQIDDPYKINAFLYEESSRIIKGVALPLFTPDGLAETYCPSFDSNELSFNRQKIISQLQNKVYMLSGSLDYCKSCIRNIIR